MDREEETSINISTGITIQEQFKNRFRSQRNKKRKRKSQLNSRNLHQHLELKKPHIQKSTNNWKSKRQKNKKVGKGELVLITTLLRLSAAMENPKATKHKTMTRRWTRVDPLPSISYKSQQEREAPKSWTLNWVGSWEWEKCGRKRRRWKSSERKLCRKRRSGFFRSNAEIFHVRYTRDLKPMKESVRVTWLEIGNWCGDFCLAKSKRWWRGLNTGFSALRGTSL